MSIFVSKTSLLHLENLVFYVNSKDDLLQFDFLDLPEKYLTHITEKIGLSESNMCEFLIETKKHKKMFVFIDKESNYEKSVLFLWKHFPKLPEELSLVAQSLEGKKLLFSVCQLSRHKFQEYKSKKKKYKIEVLCGASEKKFLSDTSALIDNIILARDLWETPASDLTPEIFANRVKKTKFLNTKVKVINYKDIQKKGLWLIEGVWKWSINKPCMVILEHIIDKNLPIQWIIWKGVTFDTWGNQIKPGDFMYDMKWDMWGAAVTYALMKELDRRKIKKNFVACLCLAENVVSSSAYKPSDILKWYNGKTVEVIHTDAEWRLVLADGISYIGKKYKTKKIMTIATLTWAVMVALGFRYAWVMWNDEDLIGQIIKYSENNTEKYVRLPLDDYLMEKTKSEIADFKNLDRSVHAGSSMWGAFLKNFLENNEDFVHIDIAGAYINEWEAYGKMPKWMTGFGVESLASILSE